MRDENKKYEEASTGLSLQDSVSVPRPRKTRFNENNEVTTRSAAPQRTLDVREDASTGLLLQDSVSVPRPRKTRFNENNEVTTRSAAPQRTLDVREEASTGLLLQDSVSVPRPRKTRFNENNEVTTRSAAPQRTLDVREDASTGLLLQDSVKSRFPFGIYIHWPFCLSKCPYCDFFSRVDNSVNQDDLITAYIEDLRFYADKTNDRTVTSIFFGGGTPSLIKPHNIEKLLKEIYHLWPIADNVETSLEANPNTRRPNLFSDLHSAGINRLSLGVQALNDTDLKFLGRTHNAKAALQSIAEITKIFSNHSIDLIYALPGQNASSWRQTLQQAADFGLRHISLYQLTIEEGTCFARKGIKPLEEEPAVELYELTTEFLKSRGYPRYEVSNYAAPGFACRHNLLYWQGDDYLGIGSGAHGRLRLNDDFYATRSPRQMEKLTQFERAQELVILGMRLDEGIDKLRFRRCCGIDFADFVNRKTLKQLEEQKLLINSKQSVRATTSGFLLLNYIISELCA